MDSSLTYCHHLPLPLKRRIAFSRGAFFGSILPDPDWEEDVCMPPERIYQGDTRWFWLAISEEFTHYVELTDEVDQRGKDGIDLGYRLFMAYFGKDIYEFVGIIAYHEDGTKMRTQLKVDLERFSANSLWEIELDAVKTLAKTVGASLEFLFEQAKVWS